VADDLSPLVLADNPLAYWKLNDALGTTLADSAVPGNYPLTLPSSAGIEGWQLPYIPGGPGMVDWAANANSYATRPNATDLAFTSANDFSIEGWIGSVGTIGARAVFACKGFNHSGVETRPWYALTMETDGHAYLWLRDGAGTDYKCGSFSALGDAQYVSRGPVHHVVGVFDHSVPALYVYIDGNFERGITGTTAAWGTNADHFEMNALNGVGGGAWMGAVAIYDHILTADRISAHFEAGRSGVAWYPYQTSNDYATLQADISLILQSVRTTYTT